MAFIRWMALCASAVLGLLLTPTVSQAQCDRACTMIETLLSDRFENFARFDSGRIVDGLRAPTVVIRGFDVCDFNSVGDSDGGDIPDFKCLVQNSDTSTNAILASKFTAACMAIQEAVSATHPDWTWYTNANATELDVGPSKDHYVIRLFYLLGTPAIEILSSPVHWTAPAQPSNAPCG